MQHNNTFSGFSVFSIPFYSSPTYFIWPLSRSSEVFTLFHSLRSLHIMASWPRFRIFPRVYKIFNNPLT